MSEPPILPYTTDKHRRTRPITLAFLWAWYSFSLGASLTTGFMDLRLLLASAPRNESPTALKVLAGFFALLALLLLLAHEKAKRNVQKRGGDVTGAYLIRQMNRCNMPLIAATQSFNIVSAQWQWIWIAIGVIATLVIAVSVPRASKLWPPEGVLSNSGHFD